MFGKRRIEELESQLQSTQAQLRQATEESSGLKCQLEDANRMIADLQSKLSNFDLEREKEAAAAMKAEYDGLRELYHNKIREFDDAREEKEQTFARDQAIQRHNLENEIRDNRQANQDYVTSTVRTFGESYNSYLAQIKVLMDALSSVAVKTGEALFSGENADLKARFDNQMQEYLNPGMDTGIVIDEEEPAVEEAPAEEAPAEPVAEEAPVEAEPAEPVEAEPDEEAYSEPLEEASEEPVKEVAEE